MDLNDLTIGPVQLSNDELLEHFRECSASFVPPLATYVDLPKYVQKLHEHAVMIGAFSGDRLIAMAACYMNDPTGHVAFISNLSMVPGIKGKGIGPRLLTECIQLATIRGFKVIRSEVRRENARALALHHRLGFTEVSESQSAIQFELRPVKA